MTNKDFLEQFSNNNKPDSFKEEERVKIDNHKSVNIKAILIVFVILAIIAGVVLFFLFRPTIEVKNFVGGNIKDVEAWVKQNDIETKGIVVKQEYNFDYDEDIVISQSINEGEKIRKNAKLDFVVSLGADPDELISLPDLLQMNKAEVNKWISDNKLTKAKITTIYSDDIEVDKVVSVDLKTDSDNFTRSTSIGINISKGPQPVGTVTVIDFSNKYYAEVETWAKTNKVELKRVDNYSDKIEKDLVISQSVEAKKEIKQGDTITVYVSLGKAVHATNLVGMDIEEVNKWAVKNSIQVYTKYEYANVSENVVTNQSIAEGKIIKEDITVNVSLGKPDLSSATTISSLKELISKLNENGANLSIGEKTYENSDTVAVDGLISDFGKVNVGTVINPIISLGKNIWLTDMDDGETVLKWSDVLNYDEDQIRKLCSYNNVNFVVKYEPSTTVDGHMVISVTRADSNPVNANSYISEAEQIVVVISSEKIAE